MKQIKNLMQKNSLLIGTKIHFSVGAISFNLKNIYTFNLMYFFLLKKFLFIFSHKITQNVLVQSNKFINLYRSSRIQWVSSINLQQNTDK